MARSFFKKTFEQRMADRCPDCELRKTLCVCEFLPRLVTSTRISLVMTVSELSLSTNTARQAHRVLLNSAIRVRGLLDHPFEATELIQSESENWILFPTEDSEELGSFAYPQAGARLNLIVPDGTWSQAKKIVQREAVFRSLKKVRLPPGPPSEYGLRESRHEAGVCTYEAVARALGILEGPELGPQVQSQMEAYFRVRTLRTLWARGVVSASDVPGGIPEAARKEGAKKRS
jgi:DTW domain-containing protein YfiP